VPMKVTHQAGATPLLAAVWATADWMTPAPETVPWQVHLLLALATWGVSTWNDWDHDNFKDRYHPAFLARWSARWMYRWQTAHDLTAKRKLANDDLHRGPTHSLEWCLLVAVVFWAAATLSVVLAPWALWFALAAFVGTASHVVLDWMTPSGVPFSIVWNYVAWSVTAERRADRQLWRRHAAGWWVPFYDVSWWLRWIRLPRPVVVDYAHPGCEPGLFVTDGGGEHMWVVPTLYACSIVPLLASFGVLDPAVAWLFKPVLVWLQA
jgi:hypothetical protein